MQTGKADPSPIVLLEVPGGTYWRAWERFLTDEVLSRGLISAEDRSLYLVTDDVREASEEMLGFYRNYHSRRLVGDQLVIRLRSAPTAAEVAAMAEEFADIVLRGALHASAPLPAEVADDDHIELPRLVLPFDRMSHGRLRQLINRLNRLPSAPPPVVPSR